MAQISEQVHRQPVACRPRYWLIATIAVAGVDIAIFDANIFKIAIGDPVIASANYCATALPGCQEMHQLLERLLGGWRGLGGRADVVQEVEGNSRHRRHGRVPLDKSWSSCMVPFSVIREKYATSSEGLPFLLKQKICQQKKYLETSNLVV